MKTIEIFKGGPQTDSHGRPHDGDAIIDKALAAYDPAAHEAPVVIGHPADNAPAWGWVKALRKDARPGGAVLLADIDQLQPEFEDMLKRGMFKKRSAAFYADGALRHVGFLGAQPPAVKGLEDMKFADDVGFFEFEDGGIESPPHKNKGGFYMDIKEFFEGLKFWNQAVAEGRPLPAKIDPPDKPAPEDKPAAFSEADIEAAKKAAADEARKAAEIEFAEAQAKAKRDAEIDNMMKELEGKVPPALLDGVPEFMKLLDVGAEFEFAEGKKATPADFFKDFLNRFDKFGPLFSELAVSSDAPHYRAQAADEEAIGKSIADRANR